VGWETVTGASNCMRGVEIDNLLARQTNESNKSNGNS